MSIAKVEWTFSVHGFTIDDFLEGGSNFWLGILYNVAHLDVLFDNGAEDLALE